MSSSTMFPDNPKPTAKPADTAPATKADVALTTAPDAAKAVIAPSRVGVGLTPRGLEIRNIEELDRVAGMVLSSGLAPNGLDTKAKVAVAIATGMELGLGPMESLQAICVINGRPSVWGQAVTRLLWSSGLLRDLRFAEVGSEAGGDWGITVTAQRKGLADPVAVTYTMADAIKAGLWGGRAKDDSKKSLTPWATNPKDMMIWKAVARVAKRWFPDAMAGIQVAEDIIDVEGEVIESDSDGQRGASRMPHSTPQEPDPLVAVLTADVG